LLIDTNIDIVEVLEYSTNRNRFCLNDEKRMTFAGFAEGQGLRDWHGSRAVQGHRSWHRPPIGRRSARPSITPKKGDVTFDGYSASLRPGYCYYYYYYYYYYFYPR